MILDNFNTVTLPMGEICNYNDIKICNNLDQEFYQDQLKNKYLK